MMTRGNLFVHSSYVRKESFFVCITTSYVTTPVYASFVINFCLVVWSVGTVFSCCVLVRLFCIRNHMFLFDELWMAKQQTTATGAQRESSHSPLYSYSYTEQLHLPASASASGFGEQQKRGKGGVVNIYSYDPVSLFLFEASSFFFFLFAFCFL
jgi:hypothetical protein